ncbi:MAG: type III pantothenate kinase [Oscillospiraceae bacterium]|nr:type III pantothenate kinase [Oscillospiraceae bacterium]MDE6776541.1 type III pantothenate kinase [Oscillospiraceae bacterium]MDE7094027.1 type III pantothenate kinase [Oscillospiraceae bacterium]
MLLAIDVGNTNIVLGCFDNDKIVFQERLSTNQQATALEYASGIKTALDMHCINKNLIDDAIISSVVPSVTATLKEAVEKYTGKHVMMIKSGIKTGLSILIDNPAQLGSDLVVDAVAGVQEYPVPMIIIDMGTATTLSVINHKKQYIGGVIMTGMSVSTDALVNKTSQLPKISFEPPKKVIGSNTIECMKSGIMYGTACALDGMISRIEQELGESCTVIATGGLASLVVPLCQKKIILDDDLLLKGLYYIYQKNRN